MEGVPDTLTLEFAEEWVSGRISEKRLKHVRGVVQVVEPLALRRGCDLFQARLAAWLHDCCKEMKDKELISLATHLGVEVDQHQRERGHLLHGPVAAAVVRKELGITHPDVLCAIAEHTLGNVPMCALSEIVYLADCLEDSRPAEYKSAIWYALDMAGELNVEAALVVAMDLCIENLLETKRPIHPLTLEVRNHYVRRVRS